MISTGSTTGTPNAPEVPDVIGGPSRTRTVDPLIKSLMVLTPLTCSGLRSTT